LDNCTFDTIVNNEQSKIEDKKSLGGFKTAIDLSVITSGKPLLQGNYRLYIKLEQLSEDNDDIKYEKIIPIADIKEFLKNNMLTTQLYYYSGSNNMKYNLL